jgi:hypothetical protein
MEDTVEGGMPKAREGRRKLWTRRFCGSKLTWNSSLDDGEMFESGCSFCRGCVDGQENDECTYFRNGGIEAE